MKRFSCGTELIYGAGCTEFLRTLGAKSALVVTDKFFSQSGLAQSVLTQSGCIGEIFDAVKPDPSAELAAQGAAVMNRLKPDLLIALGGGSSIDCAKGILLAAENRPVFAAIPTTSGTGSEVTSFSILTHNGVKHPLVDKSIRPDYAVLDEKLLEKLPPSLVADSGMDAISHCIEAAAAAGATPVTDALAGEACRILLENLPRSFRGDASVRGEIHLAATMAGLAFDSAGLGAVHALAHALGGAFHVPHGRLVGVLLPHIMDFNRDCCTHSYAHLARMCQLGAATEILAVRNFRSAVCRLRKDLHLPATLQEAGISYKDLSAQISAVAKAAVHDACLSGSPRPMTEVQAIQILEDAAQ